MEIRILFDGEAVSKRLHIGWGLSILVNNRVLFDTGGKGPRLFHNIKLMGINLHDIESIVISHDHLDHTGGLQSVLQQMKKVIPVYICSGFSFETKEKIVSYGGDPVECKNFREISKDIYVTGEIPGIYKGNPMPEQVLVIKTVNYVSVITGCAHPGILKILEVVKKHFKEEELFVVMGGFHLLDEGKRVIEHIVKEFKTIGVRKVGATHCSGEKAKKLFAAAYDKNFIEVKAGQIHYLA
ncbi:MAG: MBL fold metallo-hydrolase [Candidatus Omnitrophica bacterium]|nr:MBL fold metallo-hydrolase [Candidatus Omnitrophota bacterium]